MTTRTPITVPPELQATIDRLAEQEREPIEVLTDAEEQYQRGNTRIVDVAEFMNVARV